MSESVLMKKSRRFFFDFFTPIRRLYDGDRKFSKMVELQGPQKRKMNELKEVKIGQRDLFLKLFCGAFGTATNFEL